MMQRCSRGSPVTSRPAARYRARKAERLMRDAEASGERRDWLNTVGAICGKLSEQEYVAER